MHFDNSLTLIVFFLSSIGGKGSGGWFRSVKIMIPLMMVKEAVWQSTFGIKKTIPREIFNEFMDYCEWKNGYRTEGMTIAAKNMITKIVANTNRSFKTLIFKKSVTISMQGLVDNPTTSIPSNASKCMKNCLVAELWHKKF